MQTCRNHWTKRTLVSKLKVSEPRMAALSSSHAPTRIAHVKNREGESLKGRDLISGGGINECEFNRVLLVLCDEEINRVVTTVDSDAARFVVGRRAFLAIRVNTVGRG